MAVKLIANYAKRLGLPGYSSHQFSVSVETELTNVEDIASESQRLYQQLQEAVDEQMQSTGFVPPYDYGMANGNGQPQQQNGQQTAPNGNGADSERWNCTDGQKKLINQLVHDHKLDKNMVEQQAIALFRVGVKQINKMQASQLIEELLEANGRKTNGSRWRNSGNRQPARQ